MRPLAVWTLAGPWLILQTCLGLLAAPLLGRRHSFWIFAPFYIRAMASAFGIRRRLEGWELLPADIREGRTPAVFIANHASHFDPPLLISTLPSRPVFLAKRELAFIPFLGWVIWMAGFIFLDRSRPARALESLQRAALLVRRGQSIAAFPEGTRSPDGHLLPFRKGIFHLAREAGVPVVPLAILGGPSILPKGSWRVAPGEYTIRVGRPLDPHGFPDVLALREAAETALIELLNGGILPE